jgi:hypothetical protein
MGNIIVSFAVILAIFTTTSACKSNKEVDLNETTVVHDTIVMTDTVFIDRSERFATVSADKMKVFYIGVDNPLSVLTSGISPDELQVSASDCSIHAVDKESGKYIVTAHAPGEAHIKLSGTGLPTSNFGFRVKRIPDPIARLGNLSGGDMPNGQFKAQGGVVAYLDNFDFDATCSVVSFRLVYMGKRQDPVESDNISARYTPETRRLVNNAKPGDIYYFDNIRAKCPGDNNTRNINSMVFKIR